MQSPWSNDCISYFIEFTYTQTEVKTSKGGEVLSFILIKSYLIKHLLLSSF